MSIDELAAKYANMSDVLMDEDDEAEGTFFRFFFKVLLKNIFIISI